MKSCVGCGAELPTSQGPTPRKWCSDACRKRTERQERIDGALAAVGGVGGVEGAVRALVGAQKIEPGSYAAALAELAIAQAKMTDAGNTHSSVALRVTLANLDEGLGLSPPSDGQWFDLFDVIFSIKKEGIEPGSAIGRALLAAGRDDLLTHYPPPDYPEGYRGTALHGTAEEYAEAHGIDYPPRSREPFRFYRAGRYHRYLGSEDATPIPDDDTEFSPDEEDD
jgi:hypothetical protein